MHIHIIGICGTFMAGIALIADALGHQVTGSDQHIYPPMSDLLKKSKVLLHQDYQVQHLKQKPDLVLVGNAISRNNPMLEYVLNERIPYTSGPEWLEKHVLQNRHVLAVSGTHGKTTTTAMLVFILDKAKLNPSFLIGGIAEDFKVSARLTDSPYFVIEADEYDTAFSDKRSKFIHYHPRTLVINNIEFDHADIFEDISMIRREFHHLVRTIASQAQLIVPARDEQVQQVLAMGCWTPVTTFADVDADWSIAQANSDYSCFDVVYQQRVQGQVQWALIGHYNAMNAIAAIAAAHHVGVPIQQACTDLAAFKSVKRRMERIATINNISLYDDFAHHPTAIKVTLTALRQHVKQERILAIIEPRSNTMKMGKHWANLNTAFKSADKVFLYCPPKVDMTFLEKNGNKSCHILSDIDNIIDMVVNEARSGDHVVIMSNGSFDNIYGKLKEALIV